MAQMNARGSDGGDYLRTAHSKPFHDEVGRRGNPSVGKTPSGVAASRSPWRHCETIPRFRVARRKRGRRGNPYVPPRFPRSVRLPEGRFQPLFISLRFETHARSRPHDRKGPPARARQMAAATASTAQTNARDGDGGHEACTVLQKALRPSERRCPNADVSMPREQLSAD
jgi:hypothetical protein